MVFPYNFNLLVEEIAVKSSETLIMDEKTNKIKQAKIVAFDERLKKDNTGFAVDSVVLIPPYCGLEYEVDGVKQKFIRDEDILAFVVNSSEEQPQSKSGNKN